MNREQEAPVSGLLVAHGLIMDSKNLIPLLKLAARPGEPQPGCPSDDNMSSYIEGGLTAEEHGCFETHLADCGYCLARVGALGRAAVGEQEQPVARFLLARAGRLVEVDRTTGIHPRLNARWAIAAAVLLTLGAASLFRAGDEFDLTGPDSSGGPAQELRISRSVDSGPLAPDQSPTGGGMGIRVDRKVFSWSAVDDSLFYEVRVVSDEGDLLWQERTNDTRWELPRDLQLADGKEYFLRVDAFITETKSLGSDYFDFTVR